MSRSRRPFTVAAPLGPPALVKSRAEVSDQIQARINLGKELQARQIHTRDQVELYKTDRKKWREYNFDLLQRLFTNETVAKEYQRAGLPARTAFNEAEAFQLIREAANQDIAKLESILSRLELFDEPKRSF